MNANAVAVADRSQVTQLSETSALVHMIERMARDPSIDLARIEKLMEMHERVSLQEAKAAWNSALAEAQAKMRPVAADANNPQTRSRYASYVALDSALRPIYSECGFSLTFDTAEGAPDLHVRVVAELSKGKHTRTYHIDMPADGKGAKGGDVMTRTHATGAAVTYGRRYLLSMIFNIAVGEDDDGNKASPRETIMADQIKAIRDLIAETKSDETKFLKFLGFEKIEDITTQRYGDAIRALNAKRSAGK